MALGEDWADGLGESSFDNCFLSALGLTSVSREERGARSRDGFVFSGGRGGFVWVWRRDDVRRSREDCFLWTVFRGGVEPFVTIGFTGS